MSIFVSIVSFKDPQLIHTVKDLIAKSDKPDELYLGVFSQDEEHPDLSFVKHIKYEKVHWHKAQGAGYARSKAMSMYGGEDYYFQLDSHMRFAQGWDTELIRQHKRVQEMTGNDKVILSAYPGWFVPHEDHDEYLKTFPMGRSLTMLADKPYNTTAYMNISGVWAGRRVDMIEDSPDPVKSWTVLAGYLFANGSIAKEIPYDPRVIFMGEEMCFALRAYTKGWDIYSPNKMLVWHYYGRPNNDKPWDSDIAENINWWSKQRKSINAQRNVVCGNIDPYGVEKNDRYYELQEAIGYDFNEFYRTEWDEFVKGNILEKEMKLIDVVALTRFCNKAMHEKCENNSCECNCHEGE